ncbi:hypothetical protein GCM10029964_052290 [Kibdelosporangium lantanae]
MPYAVSGAVGWRAATTVRVRLSPVAPDTYRMDAVDADGRPVLTVDRLTLRPLTTSAGLYESRWEPVEPVSVDGDAVLVDSLADVTDPPDTVFLRAEVADAEFARVAVQEWLARFDRSCLVFVTRGSDVPTASLWGLVRSAQAEHPGRFGLLEADILDVPSLVTAIRSAGHRAKLSAGVVLRPRLVPVALRAGRLAGADLITGGAKVHGGTGLVTGVTRAPGGIGLVTGGTKALGGTVLITGGTGALGRLVARHLVMAHGVRSLVLVGRHGRSHPDIEDLAADVRVIAADLSKKDEVAAVLTAAGPLTAVVHAAGVTGDTVVSELSPLSLAEVLAAKTLAAEHLDELTRDMDLKAFVLFGSVAGVLGTAGQGAYAAANSALDAISERRRADGLPSVTIDWGMWQVGGGMAGDLGDRDVRRLAEAGIGAITADEGLALFDAALGVTAPVVVAGRIDLAAAGRVQRGPVAPRGPKPTADRIDRAVLVAVAAVLGHDDTADIDPRLPFVDLGVDSLTALELRNRLVADTGLKLATTAVFDHPTPTALAEHLKGMAEAADAITRGPADHSAPAAPTGHLASGGEPVGTGGPVDEPIAIVGMACRFPGGARTPAELWDLIRSGTDAITEFPGTAVGPRTCSTPTRPGRVRRTPGTVGSCTTRGISTPSSSVSARARPLRWIPSNGCCSRPRGRPWRTPVSTRRRCGVAGRVCSSASCTPTTARACTRSPAAPTNWRAIWSAAAPGASHRAGSHTPSGLRDRR